MKIKMPPLFSRLVILWVILIAVTFVSACGRKGDPVPITPDDKAGLERVISDNNKERSE